MNVEVLVDQGRDDSASIYRLNGVRPQRFERMRVDTPTKRPR